MHAQTIEFWFFFGAAVAAAGAGLYLGMRLLQRARLIENTPTARVRSAPQGYVELNGIARLMPGEPIRAPLTGVRCCWYRIRVHKRGDRGWSLVEQETSDHLFLLRDPTGDCIVDPDGARVTPGDRSTWYGPTPRPLRPDRAGAPERAPALLQLARLLNRDLGGGADRYRYTEERIFEGDPLYAIGMFRTRDDLDRREHRRELLIGLLHDWKRDPARLLQRFDRNRDGRIDGDEWDLARRQAAAQADAALSRQAGDAPLHRLGDTGSRQRPFLLSTLPEFSLVRRLRWQAAAAFALFLGAGWLALRLWGNAHP
ncbi:MAG TPA: hypothetical protein ENI96_01285 [Sedimenticola thiotaurini]|uniref:EF-hand domain-containing protein n=1 Tax=Sedimenticola thiotaurini TaxID=1543721 RepID=A0A831W686_9GAMM|nr:hypothetical protein [Sedimenticola thiotaurini]